MSIAMHQTQANLLEPAERFVLSHPYLDDMDQDALVHQTRIHLANQYDCSQQTAGLFAARAVANIQSRGIDAYVDIDHSTSSCVFVRVQGQLRALSISDLVKVLENEPEVA